MSEKNIYPQLYWKFGIPEIEKDSSLYIDMILLTK